MLKDVSNNVDKATFSKRFVSDKHDGIVLITGIDEENQKFAHLLIEYPIDFYTVEETDKVLEAIAELKKFILSSQLPAVTTES